VTPRLFDIEDPDLVRSRLEVEQVSLDSRVPSTVLRAAMVSGAGSMSEEILRRLVERVPFTPIAMWRDSKLQPVAIEDVAHLTGGSLEAEPRNSVAATDPLEPLEWPRVVVRA
jgi:uncharacterized protein YbjT (DUF2867 family)